jgi:hypothetical protein
MEIFKYSLIVLIFIYAFIVLILSARSGKAFKFLFYNLIISLTVFAILYFSKKYSSVVLPLNNYTLAGTALFGIPFIIGFLILNLIFQ